MRRLPLILLACLAACHASRPVKETGAQGFGAASVSFVADPSATPPPGPAPPTAVVPDQPTFTEASSHRAAQATVEASSPAASRDEVTQLERDLREQLRGPDPAATALRLAALLCDLERHSEAEYVLRSTCATVDDPSLAVALAGVHRDLGRRDLAAAGLRELRRQQGALALHPSLLFELAELEWLEGDCAEASATLAELRSVHAEDPWLGERELELSALAEELATARAPQRVRVRDLLGNLRGAPSAMVRLRTLEQLIALARSDSAAADTRALGRRILAIGAADADPAVRARTVQLGPPGENTARAEERVTFCRAALGDPAPLVRRFAAARAAELLGEDAADLVLAALAAESDPPTFAAMDAVLAQLAGDAGPRSIAAEQPAVRAATLAAWRERWGR